MSSNDVKTEHQSKSRALVKGLLEAQLKYVQSINDPTCSNQSVEDATKRMTDAQAALLEYMDSFANSFK